MASWRWWGWWWLWWWPYWKRKLREWYYDDGPTDKGNKSLLLMTKFFSPRANSARATQSAPVEHFNPSVIFTLIDEHILSYLSVFNPLFIGGPINNSWLHPVPRTQLCKSVTTDTTDRGLKPLALPSLVVVYIAKDLHWPLTLIVHVCFSTAIAPIVIYYSHPVALCSEADL